MDKKYIALAVLYCAVSGIKSLMDTTICAAVTEAVKSKMQASK